MRIILFKKSKGLILILFIILFINNLISKEVIENVFIIRLVFKLFLLYSFVYVGKVGVNI